MMGIATLASAQAIPNLPLPIGAGTAEVWNDSLYYFGGSSRWSGTVLYPRVYKFNGESWSYVDSIPDNNMWDTKSVLVGDDVYLLGGWRNGAGLVRKYNLPTGRWSYLSSGPNTTTWGITAQHVNGSIYLFNDRGNTFEYDIASNSWDTKSSNSNTAYLGLSSVVYQDEIYIIGYYDSSFHKYTPATDSWTELAPTPYSLVACAMGIINNSIYCVGGYSGDGARVRYHTILAYDLTRNSWTLDSSQISGKRYHAESAEYRGRLYVLGGFDTTGAAVDIVEEIVPLGPVGVDGAEQLPTEFSLDQNYPNPFNPITTIQFSIVNTQFTILKVYDILGREVATLVSGIRPAGEHTVRFDATGLASGVYLYRLTTPTYSATRKLLLLR